jgi:hypothetical protein
MIDSMSVLNATQKDEPEIPNKPANKRTSSRKRVFLNAYSGCGNIKAAAKAAGTSREAHYKWLESDAEYRKTFDAMEDRVGQELEELAIDRVTASSDNFSTTASRCGRTAASSIRSNTTPHYTSRC